ncbi:AsmA-like C-terminal region-containing protein [Afipia carboxidovorans]|uniref:AsmA family protein n=1 Tax=Afipia carboxidovorans TaxID=40137 RepID=UPI00308C40C1|nr:hypothetical protein CRBSH125_11120 [Afipia carboxidovorans]
MQTTLLGLAIAAIMALVAALAAPLFVDWNKYKPQFEVEASRVVGAPVRVEGALDARLLPAPILRLHKLSVGAPKDPTKLTADKLDVEFSLGSLLRGEWRATQLSLTGLVLDIGLDKEGRVIAPAKGEFNFGELAIDRLDLAGRVTLHDAASGAAHVLYGLDFRGDVRSLGGNLRGEGSFLLKDTRQPFRLALSKAGENEATRLRLDLDSAVAGSVASSLDGTLAFENRVPRFAGALTLSAADEMPWRITARTTLDPSGAVFTQGQLLSGAEATGLKLAGEGALTFKPSKLRVALSAPQLDLDRALAENKTLHGKTPAALLAGAMAVLPTLPWLSQIDVAVDRANVAGHALSGLSMRVEGRDDAWTVSKLALGGPGDSHLTLSGKVTRGSDGERFAGPVSLDASDARAFTEWAFGKSELARALRGNLRLKTAMALSANELVLDEMKLDLFGTQLEGRVTQKAKEIDVTLRSPFVDGDKLANLVRESMAWREKAGRALRAQLDFTKAKILGHDIAPLQAELSSVADGGPSKRQAFDLKLSRAVVAPWLAPDTAINDVSGRLVVTDDAFALEKFSGKLGAEAVAGNLSLSREGERSLSGNIDVGTLDIRALIAAMLGAEARAATEPLAQGWFGWRGSLAVKVDKALLPGGAEVTSVSGALRGDGASLALDDGKASIGSGALSLSGVARRGAADTAIEASLKLDKADAAALKYRELALPPGQASLRMTLATHGRSATALRNALSGNGVLTLTDAHLPRLAAATFDMVNQASEQPMKNEDLKDAVALALDQAPLAAATTDVSFAIKDGRLHADPAAFRTEAAQATISGGYDIPEEQGDLRIAFKATSSALKDAPEIQIFLHGTPQGLTRDVDVAALSSWLSLRAIERETQRLDALEKEGRPQPPKLQPQPQLQQQIQPQPQVQPPPPRDAVAAPAEMSLPPGEVKLPPLDPRRRKAAAPPAPASPALPASPPPVTLSPDARVTPLPPPIDIKPAPGALRTPRAPRSSATF